MDSDNNKPLFSTTKEVYNLQSELFKSLKTRIKHGKLVEKIESSSEFTLFSQLPGDNLGHSILYVSSPPSSDNWAVEPIFLKLLGARIKTEFRNGKMVPSNMEGIDIEGEVQYSEHLDSHYFSNLNLSYRSLKPSEFSSVSLSYDNLKYIPSTTSRGFEIISRVNNERLKITPKLKYYLEESFDLFFPKKNELTYDEDNFSEFTKSLDKKINTYLPNFPNLDISSIQKPSGSQKDIGVEINSSIVAQYKKLMPQV